MHETTWTLGGIEVVPLCDAVGPMGESLRAPLPEKFPGTPAELWPRVREAEPGAFGPAGEWILHFHCFLLSGVAGRNVLVDTGLGGADSPAADWAPVPGRLYDALAAAGYAPGDVDDVVLTHLHSDHASGAVRDGEPAFPNARYVVQRAEVDWLTAAGPGPVLERVVEPLRRAGALDLPAGPIRLAPLVDLVPTPGHTPGHQSVVLDDHRLVVAGDVVLHPVQLADPAVHYLHDEDPDTAAATRRALLDRIRARDGVLAAPHLPRPFVRLG